MLIINENWIYIKFTLFEIRWVWIIKWKMIRKVKIIKINEVKSYEKVIWDYFCFKEFLVHKDSSILLQIFVLLLDILCVLEYILCRFIIMKSKTFLFQSHCSSTTKSLLMLKWVIRVKHTWVLKICNGIIFKWTHLVLSENCNSKSKMIQILIEWNL